MYLGRVGLGGGAAAPIVTLGPGVTAPPGTIIYRPPGFPVAPTRPAPTPPQIIEVPQAGVYRYYDPSRTFVPGLNIRRLAEMWRRGEISFEEAFPTGRTVGPTQAADELEREKLKAEVEAAETAIMTVGRPTAEKPANLLPWLVLGSLLLFGG